jgi:hypothetical protein
MLFDDKALSTHLAWPTGTVHRLLSGGREDQADDRASRKQDAIVGKRSYNRLRHKVVKAYAFEHKITQTQARKVMPRELLNQAMALAKAAENSK